MRLRILHQTRYDYSPPVEDAQHVAHLKPLAHAHQRLLAHELRITPQPALLRESLDVYGNACHHFSLHGAHACLVIEAESRVQTLAAPRPPRHATPAWEKVREHFRYRAGAHWEPAVEFVFPSPCLPREEAFADFARPSFAPGRPLAQAAWDLMQRIHRHMRYESQSTQVGTPALQALQQGKGVCQDFAHILVACCRALGLPARYVSGYLLTQPAPGQARLVGSDASHAWASVFCPLADPDGQVDPDRPGFWLDLDPTNDRAPGEDYVSLATGRDFLDVSPVRGVIRGGASHVLSVAVTVEPEAATPVQAPARA
jgi:transglutaminase-like putative cysteine protease